MLIDWFIGRLRGFALFCTGSYTMIFYTVGYIGAQENLAEEIK